MCWVFWDFCLHCDLFWIILTGRCLYAWTKADRKRAKECVCSTYKKTEGSCLSSAVVWLKTSISDEATHPNWVTEQRRQCIREKDQKFAHFSLSFISLKLSMTFFEQVIVHHQEEFCTSSLQYFTMLKLCYNLMKCLDID